MPIIQIHGVVKNYTWGGSTFISNLTKIPNPHNEPFAEYWLGDHPLGPSEVPEENASLDDLIQQHPREILGELSLHQYGDHLPFLFKILDTEETLSIQVHPDKQSAEAGFKNEQETIPLESPERTYKDANEKPELAIALSDFYGFVGFNNKATKETLQQAYPELSPILEPTGEHFVEDYLHNLFNKSQKEIHTLLTAFYEDIIGNTQDDKTEGRYWIKKACEKFCSESHIDRGIALLPLMNLVHLKPKEAIVIPTNTIHAYLEGTCIEVMTNSDNVIRLGLTPKYKNDKEALAILNKKPTDISTLKKEPGTLYTDSHLNFVTEYTTNTTNTYTTQSAEILFVLEGTLTIDEAGNITKLSQGQSALVYANTHYTLNTTGVTVRTYAKLDSI